MFSESIEREKNWLTPLLQEKGILDVGKDLILVPAIRPRFPKKTKFWKLFTKISHNSIARSITL